MCRISHYIKVPTFKLNDPNTGFMGSSQEPLSVLMCKLLGQTRCLPAVWCEQQKLQWSLRAIVDTAHTNHAVVIRACTLDFCCSSARMCCQERFSFVLHFASCHLLFTSSTVLFVFPTAFTLVQMPLLIRFLFWCLDFCVVDCLAVYLPPLRACPHHGWRTESKIPSWKHFYKDWNKCAA